MNGMAEEEEHATEDVYPDGPLQSGTQSLRRIKPKSKVRYGGYHDNTPPHSLTTSTCIIRPGYTVLSKCDVA